MEIYKIVVFIWGVILLIFAFNVPYIDFYLMLKRHNKRYINEPDMQIFIPKKYKDLKNLYRDYYAFQESSRILHYVYKKKYNEDIKIGIEDSDGK